MGLIYSNSFAARLNRENAPIDRWLYYAYEEIDRLGNGKHLAEARCDSLIKALEMIQDIIHDDGADWAVVKLSKINHVLKHARSDTLDMMPEWSAPAS